MHLLLQERRQISHLRASRLVNMCWRLGEIVAWSTSKKGGGAESLRVLGAEGEANLLVRRRRLSAWRGGHAVSPGHAGRHAAREVPLTAPHAAKVVAAAPAPTADAAAAPSSTSAHTRRTLTTAGPCEASRHRAEAPELVELIKDPRLLGGGQVLRRWLAQPAQRGEHRAQIERRRLLLLGHAKGRRDVVVVVVVSIGGGSGGGGSVRVRCGVLLARLEVPKESGDVGRGGGALRHVTIAAQPEERQGTAELLLRDLPVAVSVERVKEAARVAVPRAQRRRELGDDVRRVPLPPAFAAQQPARVVAQQPEHIAAAARRARLRAVRRARLRATAAHARDAYAAGRLHPRRRRRVG